MVVEAAHVAVVQLTSLLALLAAMAATFLVYGALKRFSPGIIKKATTYIFVQVILLSAAMIAMAVYHIMDIDIAQDLWHIGAGLGLLTGAYAACNIAWISDKLNVTKRRR